MFLIKNVFQTYNLLNIVTQINFLIGKIAKEKKDEVRINQLFFLNNKLCY